MSAVVPESLRTFSVLEAADATGLSVRTLRHLISQRRFPIIKVGRSVRIRQIDLASYLERNTRPGLAVAQ